jgi:hypothetical protein
MSSTQQNQMPPSTTFCLPIHPGNVGMVIGTKGATIKCINNDHYGWAHAHLEQPDHRYDQTQPFFVITGHPSHVTEIAIEITKLAMEAKHRYQKHQKDSLERPKHTLDDFILKSAHGFVVAERAEVFKNRQANVKPTYNMNAYEFPPMETQPNTPPPVAPPTSPPILTPLY